MGEDPHSVDELGGAIDDIPIKLERPAIAKKQAEKARAKKETRDKKDEDKKAKDDDARLSVVKKDFPAGLGLTATRARIEDNTATGRSPVPTASEKEVDLVTRLPRAVLSRTIEDRMESMLGKVTVETDAQVFPLTTALPARFAASRVALVGEAAHVFPPIGAQGLNLGLRDVRDLAKVTHDAQDPGADAVLAAYDRARRPDIMARSGAVNALNRSLLSGMLPAQMARGIGIGLLGASGPLRGFFMREGMEPGSGFGSFGRSLREKVRRQEPAGDEQ